jgi:hypothetical protein
MSRHRSDARSVRITVIALTAAGLLAACGGHHSSRTSTPAITACPLTGQPPPNGQVPARPALAVKVENLPSARPQYGLGGADVIYEEPVEGGITRFIVVYQCHDTPRIEPIRSGRIVDPDIVRQFGAHPLFAYAGAIQPAVAAIDSSSLVDVGVNRAPASAYPRDGARAAPHNLMSSTTALYAAGIEEHAPQEAPPPVFTFGKLPASGQPATAVHIPYTYSDVTWTWEPGAQQWARSYADTGPATLGDGGQIMAANVVVMKVVMYPSPYVEDATGAHENLLTLTGTGPAQVFRDGTVVTGTWNRPSLSQTTRYVDSTGNVIPLSPGPTWVELVPATIGVTLTP